MAKGKMPSYSDLVQPTLTALHELGGIAGTFLTGSPATLIPVRPRYQV
jgi:hypothetical protein